MSLLLIGLLVWSAVHFIPSLAQPVKAKWKDKFGNTGYQITFAFVILLSLLMIIFGWRSTTPSLLYATTPFMAPVAMVLMFVSVALFVLSNMPTRVKQFIRHPQLTAVICDDKLYFVWYPQARVCSSLAINVGMRSRSLCVA